MWQSIPVILACLGPTKQDCKPFVGMQMPYMQCVATSQIMLADFHKSFPNWTLKGISCVEPRRLRTILQRDRA